MKTPGFLLLSLLITVARHDAIIFDRCNFTAILKDEGLEGFSGTTIADWVCLVFHSSGFDTSALRVGPKATNHGIFLLSARWWCNDSKTPHTRNYCNLSCEALRDDHITDDIHCAKRVVQESKGFVAWSAWKRHCKGQDLREYIADCDLEGITSMPQVLEKTTNLRSKPGHPSGDFTTTPFLNMYHEESTIPLKEWSNTILPAMGSSEPTVSIKEFPNTTLSSENLPKSNISIEKPPEFTLPTRGSPKLTTALMNP